MGRTPNKKGDLWRQGPVAIQTNLSLDAFWLSCTYCHVTPSRGVDGVEQFVACVGGRGECFHSSYLRTPYTYHGFQYIPYSNNSDMLSTLELSQRELAYLLLLLGRDSNLLYHGPSSRRRMYNGVRPLW